VVLYVGRVASAYLLEVERSRSVIVVKGANFEQANFQPGRPIRNTPVRSETRAGVVDKLSKWVDDARASPGPKITEIYC
jgi:hypothetical protein